jgi:hypothetical protein
MYLCVRGDRSCICVLGVSILHLYSIFQLDFGTVPTFNYIFINQLSHIVYLCKLLMVVREWLRKWQTSIQNVFIKCIWCKECYVLWFHRNSAIWPANTVTVLQESPNCTDRSLETMCYAYLTSQTVICQILLEPYYEISKLNL